MLLSYRNITQRHNWEDLHRPENLKSRIPWKLFAEQKLCSLKLIYSKFEQVTIEAVPSDNAYI